MWWTDHHAKGATEPLITGFSPEKVLGDLDRDWPGPPSRGDSHGLIDRRLERVRCVGSHDPFRDRGEHRALVESLRGNTPRAKEIPPSSEVGNQRQNRGPGLQRFRQPGHQIRGAGANGRVAHTHTTAESRVGICGASR